ncbi:MAG: hypothetical protein C0483_16665 [Pirellula sp.]|nr:hypothetical protein [Pirellula sp.]
MKRLLTWIVLVLCCGISAAAVVRVVNMELQSPPAFARADLEAWLTAPEVDGRRESPTMRRRAAWMLEQDMASGYDWSPFQQTLAEETKRRFERRWNALLGELFLQRARQFAALPTVHREGYLQTQLASMTTWYVLDDRGRHVSGPALLLKEGMKQSEVRDRTTERTLNGFRDALGKAAADILLKRFLPDAKPGPRRPD